MAKDIKSGKVLINLQTGQQIEAKGGKHTQRLIVKRGSIQPPRLWAWDYEEVPITSPQGAAAAVSIANAKLSEKDAEIARLTAMLEAQNKPKVGRKPKTETPFETLQSQEADND
jgi:hypothetical protein